MIAFTSKKVRRLHFVGACGKIPGEHYPNFEVWGELMPPDSEIDEICRNCFPRGDDAAQAGTEEAPSSSSSSSSSTSSSGVELPAKKAKA